MGLGTESIASVALADRVDQRLAQNQIEIPPTLLDYDTFQARLSVALNHLAVGKELALVWIDITKLQRAFFLRGWKDAELLVQQMARTLTAKAGAKTLVGRLSAPCLLAAIEVDSQNRRQPIAALINSLPQLFRRQLGIEFQIAAGVSFYPSDARSAEDLVRFASLAADNAARAGGRSITMFHAAMNRSVMRDHKLETEIQAGLESDQFSMVYQPKVDLVTGDILGVEGLIRWTHPEWGNVPPSEFIPVAERSSLINQIFSFTLRTALIDAQNWRECGNPIPLVTVNASVANLRRSDFVPMVRRMLRDYPVDPTGLELEVTESVLFDDEQLFTTRVRQLREIGVRVALDDFGTRYTGFNTLRNVPLDAMKIDKCFIQGIAESVEMRSICQTVVLMARHMRLRTVAEGIETYEELEILREIGCEAGQGYLLQRPIKPQAFAKFTDEWPERRRRLGFRSTAPAKTKDLMLQ